MPDMIKEKSVEEFPKLNVGIVGNPITTLSPAKFLSKFLKILTPISNHIFLINDGYPGVSDTIQVLKLRCIPKGKLTALNYIAIQIIQCIYLIKIRRKIDVLFVLPTLTLLPVVVAKILGKKTIVMAAQDTIGATGDICSSILKIMKFFFFRFADRIIVESANVAFSWKLDKYTEKICIGTVYVDFSFYRIKKRIEDRRNIAGYVGNLIKGKGIEQLTKAIPVVLQNKTDIHFIIGGEGPLEGHIRSLADKYPAKIQYIARIPEVDLPDVLNELKLLLLPSYTEGLPNIVLESMACGTPVLVTPVGAIPDIIKDGENGFVLEDNSADAIARNIERALESNNLEKVSKKARHLVEVNYSYEAAEERYRRIIESL
jgi:glycosyltransferase involved in cell wall biosynthesis